MVRSKTYMWVLILLPMLLFRRTRQFAANCFYASSLFNGFACWWFCCILCYTQFGGFWLIVGLFSGGIGVVPLSYIGMALKSFGTGVSGLGQIWMDLLGATALVIIPRAIGLIVIWRIERSKEGQKALLMKAAQEAAGYQPFVSERRKHRFSEEVDDDDKAESDDEYEQPQ